MKRKVCLLLLALICFCLVGCGNSNEKIVSREYIKDNHGQFCGNYAITNILPENSNVDIVTLYKHKEYDDYIELFETKEINRLYGNLLVTSKNIYFISTRAGGAGSTFKISGYPLENDKDNVQRFEIDLTMSHDVYQITKTFGAKDGYIYFSYITHADYNSNANNEYYGRINLDLNKLEKIEKQDIPTTFDFNAC